MREGLFFFLLLIVVGSFIMNFFVDNESVSLIVNINGLMVIIIMAVDRLGQTEKLDLFE